MSTTLTQTAQSITSPIATLTLRPESPHKEASVITNGKTQSIPDEHYRYARFLPTYPQDFKLPPLEPFKHVDPGHAALSHTSPREFLEGGTENKLTPKFGSEVLGVQLSSLDDRGKRYAC
jgi:sulfonate dioxygenase